MAEQKMREIKFRAWDSFTKSMWAWEDMQTFEGDAHLKLYFEDSDNNVMQYTGLLDKNGVEIYEGDIVAETQGLGDDYIMEVFWDDAEWILGKNERLYKTPIGKNTVDQIEVIGNVYENKELLNG